ncbi:protein slit-like [Uloborus diversus]|uniref:protein slit-like n=1 Tax=Uloborus diversus TaxID=327109 RepID=UPI0024097976|nr:protein slit-like [Uloborus diversus]
MKSMGRIIFLVVCAVLFQRSSYAGSSCPSVDRVYPCFCTSDNQRTLLICTGIRNSTHLEQVTKSFKSMIVDRLVMLNTFSKIEDEELDDMNEIEVIPTPDPDSKEYKQMNIFPKKWLSALRVRELEIQGGNLHNCFLCNEALEGQAEFLTSLIAKNAGLSGHVCSTCSLGSNPSSLSTREFKKTPLVETVDLSYNAIDVIDGAAFPSTMKELKTIILSNNQLTRINDNAFSNLHQLTALDLSRNQLTSFSRKIFRSDDRSLRSLDLSYNAILSLPSDMFDRIQVLREVKLSYNLITTLPNTTWTKMPVLTERIDLRGNFLVCNCSMKWLRTNINKSTKILAQCLLPKAVEFQDLKPNLASLQSC